MSLGQRSGQPSPLPTLLRVQPGLLRPVPAHVVKGKTVFLFWNSKEQSWMLLQVISFRWTSLLNGSTSCWRKNKTLRSPVVQLQPSSHPVPPSLIPQIKTKH